MYDNGTSYKADKYDIRIIYIYKKKIDMNLTNEEFEFLKSIEDKLYTACYCKFVRLGNRSQLEELDKVYKRVFNTTEGAIGACAHCLLNICKKVGTLYFAQKEQMEKMAEKEAVAEEKTVEKPKKAATTKKKATNKKK